MLVRDGVGRMLDDNLHPIDGADVHPRREAHRQGDVDLVRGRFVVTDERGAARGRIAGRAARAHECRLFVLRDIVGAIEAPVLDLDLEGSPHSSHVNS